LGVPSARVSAKDGVVRIDVPRHDPQPVKLLKLYARLSHSRLPFGTAVLGLADDGAPLLMRLPAPDVSHVLVAGTTGSGKTMLLQSLICSLILAHRPAQLQLLLIDPKGYSFASFGSLPHLLKPIAAQPDQIDQVLADAVELMEKRARRASSSDGTSRPDGGLLSPRVVVVIDELADVIQTGGAHLVDQVGRLVQRGREAGIHVIAATQKPTSSIIGPIVKANFPVRLVGRVVSSEDARVAAGLGGSGAERLSGHGDFLAVSAEGTLRFQAAHVSQSELQLVINRLRVGASGTEILAECQPPIDRAED
jgi:S-DNA-T family DNA segregation ATPase FtsK/SpoIIIE